MDWVGIANTRSAQALAFGNRAVGIEYEQDQEMSRKNMVPAKKSSMLMPIVGAFAGATILGAVVTSTDLMSVATSFDGALGAAAGVALAPYLVTALKVSNANTAKMILLGSGFAIPLVVSMSLDASTLAVGAGAAAGMYVAANYL